MLAAKLPSSKTHAPCALRSHAVSAASQVLKITGLTPGKVNPHCLNQVDMRERAVLVCGDSHSEVWRFIGRLSATKRTGRTCVGINVIVNKVPGASAMGLRNPLSQTQAHSKFTRMLQSLEIEKKAVVFALGSVDLDFILILKMLSGEDCSIQQLIENSVSGLFNFIDSLIAKEIVSLDQVCVQSVFPPCLESGNHLATVLKSKQEDSRVNEESLEIPTLRQRTHFALMFNEALLEESRKRGIEFLDFCSVLIDDETGVVQDRFRNLQSRFDVHLNFESVAEVCSELAQRTWLGTIL